MNNHDILVKKDHQELYRQNQELKAGMVALSKEARRILVATNVWQQEFDGQEVLSVIAMYQATKLMTYRQSAALEIAVEYIGNLTAPDGGECGHSLDVLEKINKSIMGIPTKKKEVITKLQS